MKVRYESEPGVDTKTDLLLNLVRAQLCPAVLLEKCASSLVAPNRGNLQVALETI